MMLGVTCGDNGGGACGDNGGSACGNDEGGSWGNDEEGHPPKTTYQKQYLASTGNNQRQK